MLWRSSTGFESDWLNTVDEGLELLARYSSDYLKLHLIRSI